MNYQVKLFHWPERGDHVILIACGFVDIDGFKQMFREVGEITASLSDCKVLIDLVDATYDLDPMDIKALVSAITPDLLPINPKIALVSTPQMQQHNPLMLLAASLSNRGGKVAAFYDSKSAVTWLIENF
jgi:hypothetical protein